MSLICKLEYKLDIEMTIGTDPNVLRVTVPIIISTAKVEGLALEWQPEPRDDGHSGRRKRSESERDKRRESKKRDGEKRKDDGEK